MYISTKYYLHGVTVPPFVTLQTYTRDVKQVVQVRVRGERERGRDRDRYREIYTEREKER